ncbi:MAG: TOBE domain-containing protein [Deinococcales bacterium]
MYNGKRISLGVRPEDLGLKGRTQISDTGNNTIKATIEVVEPLGAETIIIASVEGDQNIVARIEPHAGVRPGNQVELLANSNKIQAFDLDGEELNIRYK